MDWGGLAIAGSAMAIAQLVKSVSGFGAALVAMPVMFALLDPAEAILVMVGTDIITGAWLVRDVWPRIRWALVLTMFVGVIPGQWCGTELVTILDRVWVERTLGSLVVVMGAMFAIWPVTEGLGDLDDLPPEPGPLLGAGWLAGFAGGLMAGMVGAGGPPLVAYYKRNFEDQFYRAQLVTVFQLSAMALAIILISKGADVTSLSVVPWLLLPAMVGNRVGAWISPRVSKVAFGRFTGIVLVGSGIALLL